MADYVPNRVPCGKKPEPTPPPQPEPTTGMCDLKGVLYFKLDRTSVEMAGGKWFAEDDTKTCGLLGIDIDKNFYFLRAMDIETAYTITEEGRKYLVLKRFGCDWAIKVDITDENEYNYNHHFWVEDGYIHVQFPDGTEDVFRDDHGEGDPVKFLIDGENVRIVTNETIDGDGTFKNPIGIDLAYLTGTYAPADFFADITCCGLTINDIASGIGKGHAVVTKETAGRFGRLYTFGEVEALDNDLKALYGEHGWRVPTREDWGKLLDWAEPQDKNKNHKISNPGNLGDCAGLRLKSTTFWMNRPDGTTGEGADDFGFSVYPVGHCLEGMNTENPDQYDFSDLYGASTFWTSTKTDDDPRHFEVYVRKFTYGHNDVYQGTESPACRLSLRLVRDVNKDEDYDFDGYADILGNFVPTVYTTDGTQQWTSINIGFAEYGGITPTDWEDVISDVEVITYYRFDSATCSYDFETGIAEYNLPSSVDPAGIMVYDSQEDIPEPTLDSPEYVGVRSILHLDMVAETKFYYNAWDGKKWHKKVMREGESVSLLYPDMETHCGSGEPYVTASNMNHEWRVYFNEDTGLDELIDIAETLKDEISKEIYEVISGVTEKIEILSGFVGDMYDEMQSGFTSAFTAINDLQDELDVVEASVGLSGDGTFIIIRESGLTSGATTIAGAIGILDDVILEDEEVAAAAFNDLNRRMINLSGVVKDIKNEQSGLKDEVDAIEQAIGLNDDGTYKPKEGTNYLDGAGDVEEEIGILDEVLKDVADEVGDLKEKAIEPLDGSIVIPPVTGNTTYIGVNIDSEDKHIVLGDNGLYFDGDFGTGEEDED